MSRSTFYIIISLCAILSLSYFFYHKKTAKNKRIVARVGELSVYLDDFATKYQQLRKEYPKTSLKNPFISKKIKEIVINDLIQDKLLYLAALQTFPNHKRLLSKEDLQKKYLNEVIQKNVRVADEEVDAFFQKNFFEQMSPEKVHVKQILVKEKSLAQKIKTLLSAKPGSFEEVAKKHSIALEADKGGDLGYITRLEAIEPLLKAFRLNPGDISSIIESPYGYHILKVYEKVPESHITLEDKRHEILNVLRATKERELFENNMKQLVQNTTVQKNRALLNAIP